MKLYVGLVLGIFLMTAPVPVFADTSSMIISAIQTESATSASEEFITIHSSASSDINLAGWRLQYFSASATSFISPSRTIVLSGVLAPGQDYTVASTGYMAVPSQQFFSPTLSATGGHLRLVSILDGVESEHDRLGWGAANMPEAHAAAVQARGVAYARRKVANTYVDTNDNLSDFAQVIPTTLPEQVVTTNNITYNLTITELLPDPVAPQTDANDEYIEIYNESDAAIALTGLRLETGTSYSYSYTFSDQSIPARSYGVYLSSVTELTLSNTAGRARLSSQDGGIIAETAPYENAPAGKSWSLVDGIWQWSTPSSGTVNLVTLEQVVSESIASQKVAKPSTKAVKSATTKAATTKTTKDAATDKSAKATSGYEQPPSDKETLPVNPLILAGVGSMAVGYMIYEYRHDIANRFRRHKRNKENSKQARA